MIYGSIFLFLGIFTLISKRLPLSHSYLSRLKANTYGGIFFITGVLFWFESITSNILRYELQISDIFGFAEVVFIATSVSILTILYHIVFERGYTRGANNVINNDDSLGMEARKVNRKAMSLFIYSIVATILPALLVLELCGGVFFILTFAPYFIIYAVLVIRYARYFRAHKHDLTKKNKRLFTVFVISIPIWGISMWLILSGLSGTGILSRVMPGC